MECGFAAAVSSWKLEAGWNEMVQKLHRVSIGRPLCAVTYSPWCMVMNVELVMVEDV